MTDVKISPQDAATLLALATDQLRVLEGLLNDNFMDSTGWREGEEAITKCELWHRFHPGQRFVAFQSGEVFEVTYYKDGSCHGFKTREGVHCNPEWVTLFPQGHDKFKPAKAEGE